ncbi:MarR family winged helix-turn-helix transcriptional regulator [Selenomonas sp.]|uniref:MarR family winged helix-turn-helix transcriptional regulator n=1 Tax=Selenomonas sp. TaxID=2053611 RepID=UPI003FA33134
MENLQVARCFSVLDGRSRSYVLEACRPLKITYSEYVVLLRLFDCEGVSQEDLSRVLHTDKSAVARTLKLLEQKGFICREKDAEDRRIKRIRLTEYGRMQHTFLMSVMNCWVNYLIDTLSPQDVDSVARNFQVLAQRSSEADFQEIIGKTMR